MMKERRRHEERRKGDQTKEMRGWKDGEEKARRRGRTGERRGGQERRRDNKTIKRVEWMRTFA